MEWWSSGLLKFGSRILWQPVEEKPDAMTQRSDLPPESKQEKKRRAQ